MFILPFFLKYFMVNTLIDFFSKNKAQISLDHTNSGFYCRPAMFSDYLGLLVHYNNEKKGTFFKHFGSKKEIYCHRLNPEKIQVVSELPLILSINEGSRAEVSLISELDSEEYSDSLMEFERVGFNLPA